MVDLPFYPLKSVAAKEPVCFGQRHRLLLVASTRHAAGPAQPDTLSHVSLPEGQTDCEQSIPTRTSPIQLDTDQPSGHCDTRTDRRRPRAVVPASASSAMLSFRFASAVAVVALLVALLTIGSAPADAAVMGIDFGSEFIKVRATRHRPLPLLSGRLAPRAR